MAYLEKAVRLNWARIKNGTFPGSFLQLGLFPMKIS